MADGGKSQSGELDLLGDGSSRGRDNWRSHGIAVVPDAVEMTTSSTQTPADCVDCDGLVPMVRVRLITSAQVLPHQTVLTQVRVNTDYTSSGPLLLQYQGDVEDSLGPAQQMP